MSVFDINIQMEANTPVLFPSAFYSDAHKVLLVEEPLSQFSIAPCPEQLRGLHLSEK
jgi:hypothetical protein